MAQPSLLSWVIVGARRLGMAEHAPTLLEEAKRWQASRVDVSDATATYHLSALNRAKPLHGRRVDEVTSADVAELVGELTAEGRARETIRKTVTVLAMIFDHAGVQPNPAPDSRTHALDAINARGFRRYR